MIDRLPLRALSVCVLAASTGMAGQRAAAPACDPDNGGLTLAPGFCAKVVADDLGAARNLVVAPNGEVYVTIQRGVRAPGQPPQPGFLMALRDTNGATGIVLRNGYLYFATTTSVERFTLTPGQLVPTGPAEASSLHRYRCLIPWASSKHGG